MPTTPKPTERSNIASLDDVVIVPPNHLPECWQYAGPLIQRMLKRGRGEYVLHDIFEAVLEGRKEMWLGLQDGKVMACLLGQVVRHPRYSVYLIFGFAADNARHWINNHLDKIEAHARAHNCAFLEEWGRDGWERALPDWTKAHVVMRKPL